MTWADVPKGAWDADARVKDMDLDSIAKTFLYPNVALDFYMGQVRLAPDLMGPVCRAYNDYMSEWCSAHKDRLFGIALLPCDDVGEAVAELKRIAKLPSIKGALIPTTPTAADWNDPRYEPLWQAAEDLGIVISVHAGKPRGLPNRNDIYKMPGGAMIYMQLGRLSMIATFEEDIPGNKLRHDIGIDALMWASDYPHSATTWPESVKCIEDTFKGVPADELKKIVEDNVAKVYGI